MTTIAYKEGIIAYDSRATAGGSIISDEWDKHTERNGVNIFFCGSLGDIEGMIEAYFGCTEKKVGRPGMIAWDGEKLWKAAICSDEGFWKHELPLGGCFVLGSGGDHALTAMDMGATAEEAIRMAAKRDTATGGIVRTFNIRSNN